MRKKKIKHSIEYMAVKSLLTSLGVLPAKISSLLLTTLLKSAGLLKLNKLGMRNLELAYGNSLTKTEKKQILRRVYNNLSRIGRELSKYQKTGLPYLQTMIVDEPSCEVIWQGLKLGRGVILVSPHFGNWEILPGWLLLKGHPGAMVGKLLKNQSLNQFLHNLRTQGGNAIIYQHENPRKILRILQQNKVVGILPDADTKRVDGIFIQHFGQKTYTPTGPAALAISSGAPIIPIFLTFKKNRYHLFAEQPIFSQSAKRSQTEIARLTQYWSDSFEKHIRQYPDQWIWFQRRWINVDETQSTTLPRKLP